MEALLLEQVSDRLRAQLPSLIAGSSRSTSAGPAATPEPTDGQELLARATSNRASTQRWEAAGWFAPGGARRALLHHDPAAQRDRHAAHGARVPAHAHGRAHALPPHARRPHALAAGHRPRGHRHADGGRAPAERRGHARGTTSAARPSSSASGSGRSSPAARSARQMRRLGASVDWSRDRFTMDEGLSRGGAPKSSCGCTRKGLIYRGKRLVNWDPVLHTALSDLEVVSEPEAGSLWHLRYPLADGSGHVVVATTRPETMLGDTAVAVHPEDERYRHLVGQRDPPAARRPADPDHRRRVRRPGVRHRLREDHAGARLQRLRDRPAPRPAADQHLHGRRGAQRRRAGAPTAASTASRRASASSPTSRPPGLLEKIDAAHAAWCRAATAAAPSSSPGSPTSGTCASRRSPSPPSRPSRTAASASCPTTGRRPTSSGCATSRTGASAASSGGATAFRPGTTTQGNVYVARSEAEARAQAHAPRPRASRCARTTTCSTPGSRRRSGRSRRSAGRDATPELADVLPDHRAGHGLRHHLLLGRPDDHDGPEVHRRRAVPRGLHHRADPRRARQQDVEVEGQHHRPARPHRRHRPRGAGRQAHHRPDAAADEDRDREGDAQAVSAGHPGLRHRRAALHLRRARDHGPRHPLRPRPRRGLPQLLQQALERRALRADERRGDDAGRARGRLRVHRRRPLDPRAPRRAPSPRCATNFAATASTSPRRRCTNSSGTSSATGTWSSPSRCCRPRTRRRR